MRVSAVMCLGRNRVASEVATQALSADKYESGDFLTRGWG